MLTLHSSPVKHYRAHYMGKKLIVAQGGGDTGVKLISGDWH